MKKDLRQEALRLRAEKHDGKLSEGQRIFKLTLVVQIEAVVRNQILEVVEKDFEKVIGVSTAKNGYTIHWKVPQNPIASLGKHVRRHESSGNHGDESGLSETQGMRHQSPLRLKSLLQTDAKDIGTRPAYLVCESTREHESAKLWILDSGCTQFMICNGYALSNYELLKSGEKVNVLLRDHTHFWAEAIRGMDLVYL